MIVSLTMAGPLIPPKKNFHTSQRVKSSAISPPAAKRKLAEPCDDASHAQGDPNRRRPQGTRFESLTLSPASSGPVAGSGLPGAQTASLPSQILIAASRDVHRPRAATKLIAQHETHAAGIVNAAALRGLKLPTRGRKGADLQKHGEAGQSGTAGKLLLPEFFGAMEVVLGLRDANRPLEQTLCDPALVAEQASIALPLTDARGRAMLLANVLAYLHCELPEWAHKSEIGVLLHNTVSAVVTHQMFSNARHAVGTVPMKMGKHSDPDGQLTAMLKSLNVGKDAIDTYMSLHDQDFSARESVLKKEIIAILQQHDGRFSFVVERQVGAYLAILIDTPASMSVANDFAACPQARGLIARGTGRVDAGFQEWAERNFDLNARLASGQSAAAKVVQMATQQVAPQTLASLQGWTVREYKFGSAGRALVGSNDDRSAVLFFQEQHIGGGGNFTKEYIEFAKKALRSLGYLD